MMGLLDVVGLMETYRNHEFDEKFEHENPKFEPPTSIQSAPIEPPTSMEKIAATDSNKVGYAESSAKTQEKNHSACIKKGNQTPDSDRMAVGVSR